jgi:hypothetical protein
MLTDLCRGRVTDGQTLKDGLIDLAPKVLHDRPPRAPRYTRRMSGA